MEQLSNMTLSELLDQYLLLVTSPDSPEPNENTSISEDLLSKLVEDFENNDKMGKRLCYYDKESNQIKDGIHFRTSSAEE